jgi:hypothetical protein
MFMIVCFLKKNIILCGKGDNSNLNKNTVNWITDKYASKTPQPNMPIRNKNCLWWPCLLTDWDKMSNLYKRTFHRCFLPSFGSFGHAVSEEIFRNRPILFLRILSPEPLSQMSWNLVGSIYGRSSIKIAHFVPIR